MIVLGDLFDAAVMTVRRRVTTSVSTRDQFQRVLQGCKAMQPNLIRPGEDTFKAFLVKLKSS